MGNKSCNFGAKFQQKYDFISYQTQSQFGPIKIYRKKQPNYDYLMIIEKYIINESELEDIDNQLKLIRSSYKAEDQPKLLRLYGYEIIKDGLKNCNSHPRVRMYIQYFNYTLKDLIENYFNKNQIFCLDQIMYVLYHTLKTFNFYQNFNTMNFTVKCESIFLSTEGDIKFAPVQVEPEEQFMEGTCTNGLNCQKIKFKKTFKFNDKLITYEIKKIINEMTRIWNPKSSDSKEIYRFVKAINACNNVQEMSKFIYKPEIDYLSINPKKTVSTSSETTKQFKESLVFSNASDSNNSKISVKKTIKERKQFRPQTHQPYNNINK